MKLNPAIYFLFLIILSVFVYFFAYKNLEETKENKVQSPNIDFNNQPLENLSITKKDEKDEAWENYMKLKSSECAPLKITKFKPDSIEKEYINFLNELNCHEPQSISLAKEELKRLFTNPSKNDTLFYIFNEFYSNVTKILDYEIQSDTGDYTPLFIEYNPPREASEYVKKYRKLLLDNGLEFDFPEAMVVIVQDWDFLEPIYGQLTPNMVTYLKRINQDEKEGFAGDASITIGQEQFLKRILWWENFEKTCGNFIYKEKARDLKNYYLFFALHGMDNTSPFYGDNQLEKYFKYLYELSSKQNINSESVQIINKHYSIIKKHNYQNSKETEDYLSKLENEKGLIDPYK